MYRFRGIDVGKGRSGPIPVCISCQVLPPLTVKTDPARAENDLFDTFLHDGSPASSGTSITLLEAAPRWPSLAWERLLLARTSHLSLPRVLDTFAENGFEYLVVEAPEGISFWDAWDELPLSWPRRCEWLIQIAEALDQLHRFGVLLVGIRPEIVVVTPTGQAVIADLADLLPLQSPMESSDLVPYYSAPELALANAEVTARADLYGFGAMLHALLLSRELTELDFIDGVPRPFLERFPDGHPLLGRILARTFTRDLKRRFPSNAYAEADPTGFHELIEGLRACSRSLGVVRLEVAAWTNTGVVRCGNEDAVAFLHSSEARLEDSDEVAVLILADGMGGMASGEVAAEVTIACIRDFFLRHPPFTEMLLDPAGSNAPKPADEPRAKRDHFQRIVESLHEANRAVCEAAKRDESHGGMGCTAEVVVIDGQQVAIGHVGDSRVYHLRSGKLKQITQDQTLVTQLVLLGQLTEEEAASHPQRSELQQAIGGRRDVYPDTYALTLEEGDWLLVCTDGLSNQLKNPIIAEVVQSAGSAEKAARRLVNRAILAGALDNVSAIVVRAC